MGTADAWPGTPFAPALPSARYCRSPLLWWWLLCFLPLLGQAGLPEPDAIVYGSITVEGQPLTAADQQFRIEVRRFVTGPAVVVTTVGAEASAGDLYVVRIPIESGLPLDNPNAALVGDDLVVVVTQDDTVVEQAPFTIAARGEPLRIDLGQVLSDSDEDGLPDQWEQAHYATLEYGPDSLGLNGQTLRHNYIVGTDPNDQHSAFRVNINEQNGQFTVSFFRRRAQGSGYEGRVRTYTLQSSPELGGGWENVPGYVGLLGDDQSSVYVPLPEDQAAFYRAWVRLE